MKNTLKNVSEIVASANDLFYSKYDNIDTLMGIMDKALRNQGMNADSIIIDCVPINKKIVIIIYDDKPDFVEVAVGNKKGDIFSSKEYSTSEISEELIFQIMQNNFIT